MGKRWWVLPLFFFFFLPLETASLVSFAKKNWDFVVLGLFVCAKIE